jgi:outer membrane biosynthesis protein TonB
MLLSWLANAVSPCFASVQLGYWLAWGGSLALSVVLAVLMWTRWGHSRPLQKCAALSLLVHLILAFLAMTVRIVAGDGGGGGGGAPIRVRLVQEHGISTDLVTAETSNAAASNVAAPQLLAASPPREEKPDPTAETPPKADNAKPAKTVVEKPEALAAPALIPAPALEKTVEVAKPAAVPSQPETTPPPSAASAVASPPTPASPPVAAPASAASAPADAYSLRRASDRLSLIEGQGGNARTEAAVVAALNWLVAAQSRDGRWDAKQFGAGQEQMVLGQDRGGAGRNADTGVSALALLAFLGAGHSHIQGEYRDPVRRGVDFLLRSQATDGSLFGDSTFYAQMYCHSMATFALAETEAMSGDRRLEPAVTKAVNYSLSAQNAGTGGWRYRPGDTGDTSQMGWQLMSLASAKRAGIRVPDQTWNRVDRFLRSVRRGNFGGLASYRPDSPASTSMTAESLYCHLVLNEMSGLPFAEQAADEATNQVLTSLPTAERINLYYWYYATLALHHRQQVNDASTNAWHTWNDALTGVLLSTQVADGPNAGSWDANCQWGGYGGRVYTTALAAMCLEVYYRYTPAPSDQERWTTRPDSQSAPR